MLQTQVAPGSRWAPVHSSPPVKTPPQQQLLESNRGIRILQPQATAREANCRNPTLSPGFQYLRTASDIKETSPQDQHHWLGNPRAFSHCARGQDNTDSATATWSLCTAQSVLTQGYSIKRGFALHQWAEITVREQQQCHAQAGGKDTGVFRLGAMLLRLATQT